MHSLNLMLPMQYPQSDYFPAHDVTGEWDRMFCLGDVDGEWVMQDNNIRAGLKIHCAAPWMRSAEVKRETTNGLLSSTGLGIDDDQASAWNDFNTPTNGFSFYPDDPYFGHDIFLSDCDFEAFWDLDWSGSYDSII